MKDTLSGLGVVLLLCVPAVAFPADGPSKPTRAANGVPFQILQRQIDQLRQELRNIELTPGPPGPAGPEGPPGPSDAYATSLQYGSVPFDELPRIGDSHTTPAWTRHLALPPGSYVLMASVHVANLGSGPGEAWCGVSSSGAPGIVSDVQTAQIPGTTSAPGGGMNVHPTSIALSLAVTLVLAANDAYVTCFDNAPQPSASELIVVNFQFSAIKVGTLTIQH